MFAPRPEVVWAEMHRILKPGGRVAFVTLPPEHLEGLADASDRLARVRADFDALVTHYFVENQVQQSYLLTSAPVRGNSTETLGYIRVRHRKPRSISMSVSAFNR